jgi:hypothetical protein
LFFHAFVVAHRAYWGDPNAYIEVVEKLRKGSCEIFLHMRPNGHSPSGIPIKKSDFADPGDPPQRTASGGDPGDPPQRTASVGDPGGKEQELFKDSEFRNFYAAKNAILWFIWNKFLLKANEEKRWN